ncbi:MAG: DUF6796 family protein [Bacteroidota bacterium]
MDAIRRARWAGMAALLGALVSMVADTLLLYNPEGGYFAGDYAFLADFSRERLLWGHYLGILALPLHAAGIYLIYLILQPAGRKIALGAAVLGIYLVFPGVAYHANVYPLALAGRFGPGAVAEMVPFSEPLGLLFAGSFLLLMAGLTVLIFRGKTLLPRWVGFLTPALTYPVWALLIAVAPPLGHLLAPMGFNLSMAIFFAVLLGTGSFREALAPPPK